MEAWFSEAKVLSALDAEICFPLSETFYYGPDRTSSDEDFKTYSLPLALPKIERTVASMVRSGEASGHEKQLAAYYGEVIRLAREYKRSFNSIRHYFWVRFWLWNTAESVDISFPWYDSLSEINRVIDAIVSVEDGDIDHDLEQGWQMDIQAHDGLVYFRQRDPDYDETHVVAAVPRSELLPKLIAVKERTGRIVASLTEALGEDVWSSYVRHEPKFKQQAWWKRW